MSARDLNAFFEARKNGDAGLVLATVYETLGSTYSKAGERMLITGDGDFQGMLSGGCLEGDLAERAQAVVTSGQVQLASYDLRQDDEELWGLGVGCEGLIRIVLQPLSAATGFQPFTDIMTVLDGDRAGIAATTIESDDEGCAPGASLVGTVAPFSNVRLSNVAAAAIEETAAEILSRRQSCTRSIDVNGRDVRVLFAALTPPANVLVLGAGLDAEPVVRLCAELGWRVTVQDHRPAYIDKGDFTAAERVLCVPAVSLADNLELNRFDAVVVMSHHLVTDRLYLQCLAETAIPYIGLLGPRDRRSRLLAELGNLGDTPAHLESRLHGPAGLDIGGRGPTSIALSIVSQMHQILMN